MMLPAASIAALLVPRVIALKKSRREYCSLGKSSEEPGAALPLLIPHPGISAENKSFSCILKILSILFAVATVCWIISHALNSQLWQRPLTSRTDLAPRETQPTSRDSSILPKQGTIKMLPAGTMLGSALCWCLEQTKAIWLELLRLVAARDSRESLLGLFASKTPLGHTLAQMPQPVHLSTSISRDSSQLIAPVGQ